MNMEKDLWRGGFKIEGLEKEEGGGMVGVVEEKKSEKSCELKINMS